MADHSERLLLRLESIGAAVEPERPGLVCFDVRDLLRLHGGIESSDEGHCFTAAGRSLHGSQCGHQISADRVIPTGVIHPPGLEE